MSYNKESYKSKSCQNQEISKQKQIIFMNKICLLEIINFDKRNFQKHKIRGNKLCWEDIL